MPIKNYFSPQQLERIKNSSRARSLIEAGMDLFGEYGLKGTTTRMLSHHSGANPAAIPYYFGSKQGLYIATINHIVDSILSMTSPFLDTVEKRLEQGLNKKEALEQYQNVMEGFCTLFIEENGVERWTNMILREHVAPTEAYDIFYDRYYGRKQKIMRRLVGLILDEDAGSDAVMIKVHAVFGQALGFLTAREPLRRGLKGKKLRKTHHEEMKRTIRHNIHASLGGEKL
ncbi:MAG: CerR family C-terminal domain-containing protein [Desulfobacterales bacterium]|nr:CerR family C-terminal domain-containing protein [Desulfobacterales bacterium]